VNVLRNSKMVRIRC